MAYAATGELALLDKVNAIVDGLEECRAALAAQEFQGAPRYSHPGFLSAYGEWQFSALEEFAPYGEIWAPYYTLHKILAGLLDAHALAGNAKALAARRGHRALGVQPALEVHAGAARRACGARTSPASTAA